MIITYPSGSSSLQRPGRPCRWLLQPQRWGSCRAPGRAPQPSWRYRWLPFAPVWAGPGLSRSGTWSLRWWWGPRWSPVPSGSVWSTCQSPSWRSERRRRSLWREEEGRKCVKWSEVKEMWLYLAFFSPCCWVSHFHSQIREEKVHKLCILYFYEQDVFFY